MKKKIIIIVTMIMIVWLILILQKLSVPQPLTWQNDCKKKGGELIIGSAEYGSRCILPYYDAGKKCTSSNQCLGDCVTNIISQLGKEGVCQKNNDIKRCFNTIENKRFICSLDDIIIVCDSDNWDSMCDNLNWKEFFK